MKDHFHTNASSLQPFRLPGLEGTYYIKRDDLIHPVVSGNKWRKLKYAIAKAKAEGKTKLVTFGGAYSNHLVATASAAAELGFQSVCFVRGEEAMNNHYLQLARLYGMQLIQVSREAYLNKADLFMQHFHADPTAFYIAEGGESEEASLGVAEIISELPFAPDIIVHASATGTTSLGLAMGIKEAKTNTKLISVAVLKNGIAQKQKLQAFENDVEINEEYTFGGYAKTNPELIQFVKTFISETGILIDPVYTGKALFAMRDLIKTGKIESASKVLFLHTGGTLGIFSEPFLKLLAIPYT